MGIAHLVGLRGEPLEDALDGPLDEGGDDGRLLGGARLPHPLHQRVQVAHVRRRRQRRAAAHEGLHLAQNLQGEINRSVTNFMIRHHSSDLSRDCLLPEPN